MLYCKRTVSSLSARVPHCSACLYLSSLISQFGVAASACSSAVLSKSLYVICGFFDLISCTIWQQDFEALVCLYHAVTGMETGSLASLAHSISLNALSYPLLPLTAPRSSGKCFSSILFSCPSAVLLQQCKVVRHSAQSLKAARFLNGTSRAAPSEDSLFCLWMCNWSAHMGQYESDAPAAFLLSVHSRHCNRQSTKLYVNP